MSASKPQKIRGTSGDGPPGTGSGGAPGNPPQLDLPVEVTQDGKMIVRGLGIGGPDLSSGHIQHSRVWLSPHGTEWEAETYEEALEMERDSLVEQLQAAQDSEVGWGHAAHVIEEENERLKEQLDAARQAISRCDGVCGDIWADLNPQPDAVKAARKGGDDAYQGRDITGGGAGCADRGAHGLEHEGRDASGGREDHPEPATVLRGSESPGEVSPGDGSATRHEETAPEGASGGTRVSDPSGVSSPAIQPEASERATTGTLSNQKSRERSGTPDQRGRSEASDPAMRPEASPFSEGGGEHRTRRSTPSIPEGTVKCPECGASIAWEGELPDDCLRCGVSFQDTRGEA